MRFIAVSPLLLVASVASANCPFETDTSELVRQVDLAQTAYGNADVDGFTEALDELAIALTCVTDKVTPSVAARVHLLTGVRAFGNGDKAKSKESFSAARTADPGIGLPVDMVPEGHPLHTTFRAAVATDASELVPTPVAGSLMLDGKPATSRPTEQAVIAQLLDAAGRTSQTRYVFSDDEWLEYEGVAAAAGAPNDPVGSTRSGPDPLPDPPRERPTESNPMLAVAGGSAVLAVAGFVGAGITRGTWNQRKAAYDDGDTDWTSNQARGHMNANHALMTGGLVFTGVTALTGTVALTGSF